MRQFFKTFFACLAAIFVVFFIGFIILIAMASIGSSSDKTVVKSNSILHIDLNEAYNEQSSDNPLAILEGGSQNVVGLNDVIASIEHAKNDKNIKGIYLKLGVEPNGWASLGEMRMALKDFKGANKFIYAYGEVCDQKSYYLASVSDKIFINPHGMIEFKGLAMVGSFLKGTLDKLGVKVEAFHCGQFKGAHEPFSRKDFSEPNEFQLKTLLTGMDSIFLMAVGEKTNKNIADLRGIANNLDIKFPSDAKRLSFIDDCIFADSVRSLLKSKTDLKQDEELRFVSIGDYAGSFTDKKSSKNKIAILYAEGSIADGKGKDEGIYSEDICNEIRKIAKDAKVKALVLRVNSPGGSALASEIIYNELQNLHKKMPIVVSMGNVAASGGYYISCAGDKIYADANTITGSIGVVGIMFNLGTFMESKLGVNFDAIKTEQYADFPNTYRDMTAAEHNIIQAYLDSVYVTFKTRVADARKLTLTEVENIAQGHVYTGMDALNLKLVDAIGGINDALKHAVTLAKVKDYKVVEYPKKESGIFAFLAKGQQGKDVQLMKEYIGEDYKILKQIKELRKQQNKILAQLPFQFDIR